MAIFKAAMAAVLRMYAVIVAPSAGAPAALCSLTLRSSMCEPGCWCAHDKRTNRSFCRPCTDVDCSKRNLMPVAEQVQQAACCAVAHQGLGSLSCKTQEFLIESSAELVESVPSRLLDGKADDKGGEAASDDKPAYDKDKADDEGDEAASDDKQAYDKEKADAEGDEANWGDKPDVGDEGYNSDVKPDSDDDKANGEDDKANDEGDEAASTDDEEIPLPFALGTFGGFIVISVVSTGGVYNSCETPSDGVYHETCDPALSCPALYPFVVWGITVSVTLLESAVAADGRSFRIVRILEPASLITGLIGVAMVRKRRQAKFVTRGCECVCPCPFPAWSLFVQLLDFLGVILWLGGGEMGGSDVVFAVLTTFCIGLDITFATTWLLALHAQDGDICCGKSGLPRLPHQPGHEHVVGAPVPVAGQTVTAAEGSDQAVGAKA